MGEVISLASHKRDKVSIMDAFDWAAAMVTLPKSKLPAEAAGYVNFLVGVSPRGDAEVPLRALAHYAQAVLKMPCRNEHFMMGFVARNYFELEEKLR